MSRSNKTTLKEIADYWVNHSNICETELNFDWADSYTHCWNCGHNKQWASNKKPSLEKCHIIPHSLGGKDIPSNYVLLCKDCHRLAPNTSNPNDMWEWIKSNYTPFSFTGTYHIRQALVMFKQKEGCSFFDKAAHIKDLSQCIKNELQKTSVHFSCRINASTLYFTMRNIIQDNLKRRD